MEKLYDRIDWNNNTTPALNETNLNAMSKAIDDIDDRVIDIADDVLVVVPEILDKYADIEALTTNPPYIGQNGHWWTWDTDTNQYVDSGVDAGVSVTVGTTTTLAPGSSATVTNSGTDTDPVLNFGIPQGATGQDGADGVGVPSGGTTGQVLKKVSGTDYDTEWANESGGGSGGHTIINSAGTSMTQRDGLQFSGLNVTDDSGNDKTVVTLPTPDYVDAQYNSSTTYSKGMTCISGNVRYRYKNSTASSGHQPPNATYWEVYSVASQFNQYIDLSVFADNANFIAPSSPNTIRATIESGGYRQVGKLVYVYITIKPASSYATFWQNGGGGGVIAGFPKAAFTQNMVMCNYRPNAYSDMVWWLGNNAVNEGQLSASLKANQSMDLTKTMTIQCVYLAE